MPRTPTRPLRACLPCLAIALISSGCAPATPPVEVTVATDVSCRVYRVITWSPDDTRQTIAEVRTHNAKHRTLCARGRGVVRKKKAR